MGEVDAHAGLVLVECGDAVAEEVLDACAGVLVHHPYQVLAQHLDVFAVEPAAAEGRLGGAVDLVTVRGEDRHAAHPGPYAVCLLQQAHTLHDFERDAADVHRLAAGALARGAFDDGGREAVTAQPVGEDGPGDSAAGDEYGLHEKFLPCFLRCTRTERTTYARPLPTGQISDLY